MDIKIKKFFRKQIEILNIHNINYHSINIELVYDKKEDKLKKTPLQVPPYKDKKLTSFFDNNKNGLVIPLGEIYNCLIGVDVDNKNGTLEFFEELALDNEYDLNTLSVKTINNGMHYYFRLNDIQREELKNFTASTGQCFTTNDQKRNIDIKYNNQIFFGPSYIKYDDEIKTYEIENDTKPDELPDFLFNEILRIYKLQNPIKYNSLKEENDTKENNKKIVIKKASKERENIIKNYLECLDKKRFDSYDDWLSIGAILWNEGCSYELFDEYSQKSEKYEKNSCQKLWINFSDDREKKATIKKLIELAEIDSENNKGLFERAIVNDCSAILDLLYINGPSDVHMGYLFYNLNKDDFVYDDCNEQWYNINKYGIYVVDKKGDTLKNRINHTLLCAIKKEYIRLLKSITNDEDTNQSKNLFKKYQSLMKYCTSTNNKENLIKEVRLLYTINKIYEKMDTINPNLIGFLNGVYDLGTFTFRRAKKEEFVSVTTNYEYEEANPEKKKEAWNILESIFSDKDELKYVLKHISLGLYGVNPEEKFYIWIGTGGNGKGILRDIIQVVLGEYYDSMDINYLYKSNIVRSDAPNPVMAKKKNSRFVVTTEPECEQMLKCSILKSLSGNDPQQVRDLYGSAFNYIPKFKLVVQTNNDPLFEAFDGGMRRRPVLIRFSNKFVETPVLPHEKLIDKSLKKKIVIDKIYNNEFFEIFVEHYKIYLNEGLKMPERFLNDTAEFVKNNDPVNEWIEANIVKTNDKKDGIKANELYENYLDYMNNDDKGISSTKFKNILFSEGIIQKKKSDANYYIGIKYKK
jgi:P4 family phage/plasmid primase-like protien